MNLSGSSALVKGSTGRPQVQQCKAPLNRSTGCFCHVRDFREKFKPEDSNIPQEYFITPPSWDQNEAESNDRPWFYPKSPFEQGFINVLNPYSHKTRAQPISVPTDSILPSEEIWVLELERNLNRDLPGLGLEEGKLRFYPGFLNALSHPDLPNYFVWKGIQVFQYSLGDRVVQGLTAAVCVAAFVTALLFSWQTTPLLTAAILASYAQNKLSVLQWVMLAGFAFTDRMWLYWVFFVGKRIDEWTCKNMPETRELMMGVFCWWLLYVFLSPLYCYPMPFPFVGPGGFGMNDAFKAFPASFS